jgi:cytochrome P450
MSHPRDSEQNRCAAARGADGAARRPYQRKLLPNEAELWIGLRMAMRAAHHGDGPKGTWLLGNLRQFGRDPLGFLEQCARDYGDFVPLRFGNRTVCLLNDPAHIESVLTTQSRHFRKTLGYRTPFMRRLFGQGLLTSESEFWLRQRRLTQPAFHRDRIATYADIIVGFAERLLKTWKVGEMRGVHQDMMRLTTEVVTKTLFNKDVPPEIDDLFKGSSVVLEHFTSQWSVWRFVASFVPTPGRWQFERVIRRLDKFIYELIDERRASAQDTGDLLSMLLLARDERGNGMSNQQLRDELTTLMLAGLDTTALALSWAFYLLSQNLPAEARLFTELQSALGDRLPRFADLSKLAYTEAVVKETMRLYPSAWIIGREALDDCEIGGHPIARGTSLVMSQWLKHRDSRYFEQPEKFSPGRWVSESARPLPKYAYFPFGGGPRACIGNSFAMMEAVLVLATVAQRFRLTATPGYTVEPWATITLQPRGGLFLKVEPREPNVEDKAKV